MCGSDISARPTASIWRWPPDSVAARFASIGRNSGSAASTASSCCGRRCLMGNAPISRFSSTLISGNTFASWGTMFTPRAVISFGRRPLRSRSRPSRSISVTSTFARRNEPVDHLEERGLARAIGPDHGHDGAARNFDGHAAKHVLFAIACPDAGRLSARARSCRLARQPAPAVRAGRDTPRSRVRRAGLRRACPRRSRALRPSRSRGRLIDITTSMSCSITHTVMFRVAQVLHVLQELLPEHRARFRPSARPAGSCAAPTSAPVRAPAACAVRRTTCPRSRRRGVPGG